MPRPASDTRIAIVRCLAEHSCTMRELRETLGLSLKSADNHLARLGRVHLVTVIERRRVEYCRRPVAVFAITITTSVPTDPFALPMGFFGGGARQSKSYEMIESAAA